MRLPPARTAPPDLFPCAVLALFIYFGSLNPPGAILIVAAYCYAFGQWDRSATFTKSHHDSHNPVKVLDQKTFERIYNREDFSSKFKLIDIRTTRVFNNGHIEGSINMPPGAKNIADEFGQKRLPLIYSDDDIKLSEIVQFLAYFKWSDLAPFDEVYVLGGGVKNFLAHGGKLIASETSWICRNAVLQILPRVFNQLSPKELCKTALTCTDLYDKIMNMKGAGAAVKLNISMDLDPEPSFRSWDLDKLKFITNSESALYFKVPCPVTLDLAISCDSRATRFTVDHYNTLLSFLGSMWVERIREVSLYVYNIECWPQLLGFLQDYVPDTVMWEMIRDEPQEIGDRLIHIPISDYLLMDKAHVSNEALLRSQIPNVRCGIAVRNKDELYRLIEKCMKSNYDFGYRFKTTLDQKNLNLYPNEDFIEDDYDGPLPDRRPLFFRKSPDIYEEEDSVDVFRNSVWILIDGDRILNVIAKWYREDPDDMEITFLSKKYRLWNPPLPTSLHQLMRR